MSSDAVAAVTSAGQEADDQPRNRRQEETFQKVLAAGREMLRESSYADLTVRAVAARAKVAPATAYTYFSSKNHLIAEVYLDLVKQAPFFTDVNDTQLSRVQQTLRSLALVIADEPEVAVACTTAVLSNDSGVRPVREHGARPTNGARRPGAQWKTRGSERRKAWISASNRTPSSASIR